MKIKNGLTGLRIVIPVKTGIQILTLLACLLMLFIPNAEAVTFLGKTNFGYSTTESLIETNDAEDDTFTIESGTGSRFPSGTEFLIVVYSSSCSKPATCASREIIRIKSRSGTTLTIKARDQEGTSHSTDWGIGSKIDHMATAGTFTEMENAINDITATGDVNSSGDCLSGACGDGSSDGGTYYRFFDASGGAYYLQIQSAPNLSGNITVTGPKYNLTFPTADGSDGQYVKTDGAGHWSHGTPTGSGTVTKSGDCTGGDCGDGSSDGGTYYRLYDGNSNYTGLKSANVTSNADITLPDPDSTSDDTTYFCRLTTAGVVQCTQITADLIQGSSGHRLSWDTLPGLAQYHLICGDASGRPVDCSSISIDFSSGTLEIPNGSSLPGTCTVGQIFHNTTTSLTYTCTATNIWTAQAINIGQWLNDTWTITEAQNGGTGWSNGDCTSTPHAPYLCCTGLDTGFCDDFMMPIDKTPDSYIGFDHSNNRYVMQTGQKTALAVDGTPLYYWGQATANGIYIYDTGKVLTLEFTVDMDTLILHQGFFAGLTSTLGPGDGPDEAIWAELMGTSGTGMYVAARHSGSTPSAKCIIDETNTNYKTGVYKFEWSASGGVVITLPTGAAFNGNTTGASYNSGGDSRVCTITSATYVPDVPLHPYMGYFIDNTVPASNVQLKVTSITIDQVTP
jgi:hypothetical protein